MREIDIPCDLPSSGSNNRAGQRQRLVVSIFRHGRVAEEICTAEVREE
jgi:hypothetical protein